MTNATIRTGALALAAIVVAPTMAIAQDREMFELPAIQVEVQRSPLHIAAIELYETPARWEEAGELHEQAAKQLTKNDAGQFFAYNRAAVLYLYSGNTARSRKAMEKAATVAEATGDVLTAANAWVDAAFIAVAEGFAGKRREFVANARSIAEAGQLSDADSKAVLARIDGAPTSSAAARVAMISRMPVPGTLTTGD